MIGGHQESGRRAGTENVPYIVGIAEAVEVAQRIEARGRLAWLADEFVDWQDQLELTENTEQWRRVSGSAGLSRRQLAIVRELWRWRDAEAP